MRLTHRERWTKADPACRRSLRRTLLVRWLTRSVVTSIVLHFTIYLLGDSSGEQRLLSVYSPVANYSLQLAQREGRDYVGLLEMLEPLGTVTSKTEGQNWKLRFNGLEGVFPNGSSRIRVRGKELDLPARFLLENGRGLVPLDSVVNLLPGFLGFPVVFHASARRLFIRQDGTTYSAQLTSANPAKLVLNFSSPVNPKIATEAGKLRMTFNRDPVIASGPAALDFGTSAISSALFAENNGAAEILVSGSVPLLATFGNDGRTITITPAPLAAPSPQTAVAPQSSRPVIATTPANPTSTASTMPSAPPATVLPVFAVIDPSHGGAESGASLSSSLLEKDVTLAFGRQLRQEFQTQGMTAMLLRDSDVALTPDQRAAAANAARPAIYISLHAASDGKGARVYTAVVPDGVQDSGPFVAWDRAQAGALGTSQMAATAIIAELGKSIPARSISALFRPLDNVIAPAIAIEIGPRDGDVNELMASDYQRSMATSVVAGITSVRAQLEAK